MSCLLLDTPRVSCAVNLDLSQGWHPASARIEWFEPVAGEIGMLAAPDARLALFGWIDRPALERLDATLDELSHRGIRRLLLDCARVRHVEFGAVRLLTSMLSRCAPHGLRLRGLSPHLRDLFRLAGCRELVPSGFASGLMSTLPGGRPQNEWTT